MPKTESSRKRSRSFAITSFGEHPIPMDPCYQYLKGIQEICPESHRLHWQQFVYRHYPTTLSAQIKMLPPESKSHVEICNGSPAQNIAYCSMGKGRTPADTTGVIGTEFTHGVAPAPGTRSDLADACVTAVTHSLSACTDSTIVRYHRGLTALRLLRMKPQILTKYVVWHWGPTMTGKTEAVWKEAFEKHGDSIYSQANKSGFFDAYDGEKAIILDEYERGVFTDREILSLLHKYPHKLNTKFGTSPAMHESVFITSNRHPSNYIDTWRWPELERRITKIIEHTRLSE